MALDEPSAQLLLDLRASIQETLATRRPLLHHLNADSSWLLQIPRPESAIRHGARVYFNILLDPWFSGPQSDVASWFSQQFHQTPSAVQTVAELEELAREVEILASGLRLGAKRKSNAEIEREGDGPGDSFVDAVAISHEFTDHCHKDTLLELHKDVPIFAVRQAAKLVQGWGHFRTVITISEFGAGWGSDWRSTSVPPLPDWVGISRLRSTEDVLDYHSALMITWNNRHRNRVSKLAQTKGPNGAEKRHHAAIETNEDEESAEALIYTPHGIHYDSVAPISTASPRIDPLAFLHGLHNVKISSTFGTALQLNLGSHNGLKAQRILNAKYWIGTHDELKQGGGFVAWFLQRKVMTIKEALDEESKLLASGQKQKESGEDASRETAAVLNAFEGCNWLELWNGESRVLV